MEWIQRLLESGTTPIVTAFLLGLLTAISPCPLATNIAAVGFIGKDIDDVFGIEGFSFVGSSENVGMAFIRLKPWDERDITVPEFIQQANPDILYVVDRTAVMERRPVMTAENLATGEVDAGFMNLTQALADEWLRGRVKP